MTRCAFCGAHLADPCESAPIDTCERALNHDPRRAYALALDAMETARVARREASARFDRREIDRTELRRAQDAWREACAEFERAHDDAVAAGVPIADDHAARPPSPHRR